MCDHQEHQHHHHHPHHGGECGCDRHGDEFEGPCAHREEQPGCCCDQHHHRHEHGCCCGGGHHHHCECACHAGMSEPGFHRRFPTREERIAELQGYLQELRAEAQGVEERIRELQATQ